MSSTQTATAGATTGATVIPFPASWIEEIYGARGILARENPRYEKREGQIQLSRAVHTALTEKRNALLEGPCGTGKGLAYLIPVIRWVQANPGKRVVIATETIALQEQLVTQDLPLLQRVMPGAFSFALAKGRGQYLCNDAFGDWIAEPARSHEELALRQWGKTTKTGSKTSLPMVPNERLWSSVTVDSDDCKGKDCPSRGDCFYEAAKAELLNAQILVTNYKLLCAHLALVADGIDPVGLPLGVFHAVVCDEAHGLPDIARDSFGATLRETGFRKAERYAREFIDATTADTVLRESAAVFAGLRAYIPQGSPRLTFTEFPVGLEPLTAVCEKIRAHAASALRGLDSVENQRRSGGGAGLDEGEGRTRSRARSVSKRFTKVVHWLRAFAQPVEDLACWVEQFSTLTGPQIALEARRVDVAPILHMLLWSQMPSILCSATLTVEGQFHYIEGETGIARGRESEPIRLVVESPFDFANRVLVCAPAGIPSVKDPVAWRAACARVIDAVVSVADGRTLALFSSAAARDAAFKAVAEPKPGARRWLRQGDAPTSELARQFKSDARSVLFGTKSFWTGVDVPGESLVAVVIDRVPFMPPDDPIIARMHTMLEAQGRNAFELCDKPRALMQVRQAFGRLMRAQTDYGVVVILDPRVNTAGWRHSFWRSLPKCRRGDLLADVRAHLARFAAPTTQFASTSRSTSTEAAQ